MPERAITRRILARCGLALLLAAADCAGRPEPAELLLHNGRIVTLDPERPEAGALAAREGRIVAVGADDQILRYRGPGTRVIDLEGRLAIPGFIEGHAHFSSLGVSLMNVDLRGSRTWEEAVGRVAAAAAEAAPGEWIVGRGWHQDKWDPPPRPNVEGYPTHDALSAAVPDNPVLLSHVSGHASIANARALELAGIGPSTPDPPGGTILRHPGGRPTGVLRETAQRPAWAAYEAAQSGLGHEEAAARARRALQLADRHCLAHGVTSFQDAGADFATVDRMRAMAEAGELGVRLWVMLDEDNDALEARAAEYRVVGAADDHLTVRAVKRLIDGALGAHGAWLLEPYADLPGSTGLNTLPLDELERTARIAVANDLQLCVHAIGDRGNRETLDLYERVFSEHPERGGLRWRIEHAQHLHPDDIPRFAALGVIASMQGIHCTSDAPWVVARLGEERAARGAYVWRSLIDSGATVSNGTDAPVEEIDPIPNFYSLVTRRPPGGEPFHPGQSMTRTEALRAYTIDAAYAAFEEGIKGSLAPGKLADVTVLSRDILTVPEARILDAEVVYTIVGGRVLYQRAE